MVRRTARPKCPKCGSEDVVPILYGLPGPKMERDYAAGRIDLGGSVITGDDPQWRCKDCGYAWRTSKPHGRS